MTKKKKPAPKAKAKRKAYSAAVLTDIVNRHEVDIGAVNTSHNTSMNSILHRLALVEESARKAYERLTKLEMRSPTNLVERLGLLESANWRHQERAPILTEIEVLQLRVFLAAIKGVRENGPR